MSDNVPKKLVNPLQALMMGGMPGLPSIIQNAMPVPLPQMTYDQSPLEMIFGNFKRARLNRATELEANIAINSNRALHAKLDSIFAVVTFSAKIDCGLAEFNHKKTMFQLEEEKARAEIFKIQADATTAGYEAKLSELEYKMRLKQFKTVVDDDAIDLE